jgi:mannose-6-phosphate isomerase-like protein (cupin superfamily)
MHRETDPTGAPPRASSPPAGATPVPGQPGLLAAVVPAQGDDLHDVLDELGAVLAFLLGAGLPLPAAAAAAARALTLPPLPSQPSAAALRLWAAAPEGPPLRVEARADRSPASERPAWGRVDLIDEGEGWGLVRLVIAPGATLPHHLHREMDEWERVLTAGLAGWRGEGPTLPLARGAAQRWPRGLPHGYQNPSAAPQALLCLNRPAFLPADEIVVPRAIFGDHLPDPPGGA